MRNKSVIPFVLVVGALIAWGLHALFAAYPMLPPAASAEAVHVDKAWDTLFWVETTIYAVVVAFLLYCLYAFRARSRSEQGEKFAGSRGRVVEVAWVLVSIALTLALAAMGTQELRAVVGKPEADIDVEVRAQQFSWEFFYPKQNQFGAKLFLERGKRHRIILTSKDVVHSFWVPELRLKQDAVPGKVIPLYLTPTKNGEYTLICSQLCGMQHTDMTSTVVVLDHEDFENAMKAEF